MSLIATAPTPAVECSCLLECACDPAYGACRVHCEDVTVTHDRLSVR